MLAVMTNAATATTTMATPIVACGNCGARVKHLTLRECIESLKYDRDSARKAWEIEHRDSELLEAEVDNLRAIANAAVPLWRAIRHYSNREIPPFRDALEKAGYVKPEEA